MENEIDFDDLLAEAENEANMYDDYMDDIEAEMAMEEEAFAETPKAGSRLSALGIGLEVKGGVYQEEPRAAVVDPLTASRKNCPSPAPLEQRLGVSPVDYEEEPFPGLAHGDGEALKALNSEGLSPLHPVLKERSNSRWNHRRFAAESKASNRATCGDFRPMEDAASSSSRVSQTATRGPMLFSRLDAVKPVDTKGIVLNRPSTDGDSVPFMQSGGKMMHLRVHRPSQERSSSFPASLPPPGNLLKTPFATLTDRVMERRVIAKSLETSAEERAAAAAAIAEAGLDEKEIDDGSNAGVSAGKGGGKGRDVAPAGGALWVDKYAPESFRDLLSDERVNREVLRAVKAWDRFVFKKEPTIKTSPSTTPGGRTSGREGEPVDKRPDVRVIMLCGAPGLGKTTLAHVVARHAGYRVYEINASDDRSAPVLKQRLVEAMEGNTLLADKRPNLIVLDEVDGADGKAAVQVIVDFATAPLAKATGGKKTKRKRPLTRPLVLICNDQWTPALRPIRALAQVFVFRSKASPSRLVQRLKAICSAEGLCVNTDALTRLADKSHLDVRSCLNTLQFVARRAALGDVMNASAALLTVVAEGIKDDRRDLFEVLRSVFTRRKSGTKRRLFLGGDKSSSANYVTECGEHDLLQEVEAFNDHGKVVAGVHENFLGVRFNDPTLCKVAAAVDWLAMADLMDARTSRSQDYSFCRYLPLAAAGVHYLCRSDQRAAVTPPKKDYEARMARSAKRNILLSFVDGRQLTATARSTESVVLDMLSHLMDILAPSLRPLNPDLLSSQERTRLSGLVGVLLSCGLTFAPRSAFPGGGNWVEGEGGFGGGRVGKPSYSADGIGAIAPEFVLEPAIDQLVKYEGYDFAHPILAAPLRSIVAHEVSLEAMRQTEASKASYDEDKTEGPGRGNARSPSTSNHRKDRHTNGPPPSGSSAALTENRNNTHTTKITGAGNTTGKGDTLQNSQAAAPERRAPAMPFWNSRNRNKGTSLKDDSATGAPSVTKRGNAESARGVDTDGGNGVGNGSKRPRMDSSSDGPKKSTAVRYQFRAGYTNAVRRPVRMKDLL